MRSLSLHTSDGQVLAGDLAEPDGVAVGGVVVCHPHPQYGGDRFNTVVDALFTALPRAGFTTVRFDFRSAYAEGIGERLDVVAALDALDDLAGPRFVAGYSFGAIVALTTHDPRVAAVVAVAPPLTADVAAPGAPTLVLSPRHDQFCPPDKAASIVGAWPAAELEPVEGADHFLVGQSAAVATRTVAWLGARLP
jgi:alpha/beta superfamily hydrolase